MRTPRFYFGVTTAAFVVGLSILIGIGCVEKCSEQLPTISELLGDSSGVLTASVVLLFLYSSVNTLVWYKLHWGLAALETIQNAFLAVTLASYSECQHRGLAITFVCLWYVKILGASIYLQQSKLTVVTSGVLFVLSLSFLATFAFSDSGNEFEYAGCYLLALTNLPVVWKTACHKKSSAFYLIMPS